MITTPNKRRRSRSGGYSANSYRTPGLVLRTYRLGEADRIIVILTPEYGQIRAVAKGVRRTSSRFGASLEPFTHTQLQMVRGKGLEVIAQTQTLHPYGSIIAADYTAYGAASAMTETAERLTAADVESSVAAQYRLLHGALAALARKVRHPRLILDSYLLRALSTAGWAPSFTSCARCGTPGPHNSVNVALGGVVCPDCRPSGSLSPAPETIVLLAALLSGDWKEADQWADLYRAEASKIVAGYFQYHSERHLKSLSVMDQQ